MAASVELQVVGEKTLHLPLKPDLLAYCPSMELLAAGSTDQNVLIYRLNGQRVFGANQKAKGAVLDVQKLGWKPNGQLLAVAWSDGTVRLLGAESNKTVHQISVSDEDGVEVTCLAWASNSTANKTLASILAKAGNLWDDVIAEGKKKGAQPLDLPRDLASIDIESSMPKLSVLPSGGTTEDIFSSRASLDALFRPFDPKDNDSVDVMVVGTSDGHIHLSIYDSFVVGSFPSPLRASKSSSHQLVLHASHKNYSVHGLLMKSTSTLVGGLYFVPMDLRFITSSGHLSLLASRSTALQNLLRYIRQVQTLMAAEFHASQDLPSKFLRNINETLAEHGGWTIVPALYHQVVTGHTLPEVKEWLVDELAERGHKRWDKAVTSSLTTLRTLLHTHLLPALTRCSLLLSRLHGLALYQVHSSSTLGFSAAQISLLLDTIASLTLVSTRMLTYVISDLEHFSFFSTWLRLEIDRLASSDSAQPSDEAAEKESSLNHGKILEYIHTSLLSPKLAAFFADIPADDATRQWDALGPTNPIFDILSTQLHKHADDAPFLTALPNLKLLIGHLDQQAGAVFKQIAEAEKRNVLFGSAIEVAAGTADAPFAMTMVAHDERCSCTYIARVVGDAVTIARVRLETENGVSRHVGTRSCTVDVDGGVLDVAFLDERTLVVLWEQGERRALLAVPFRCSAGVLGYQEVRGKEPMRRMALEEMEGACRRFGFAEDRAGFVPEKLQVSGPGKVVVLGKGGLRYKIFMIPEKGAVNEGDTMKA